MSPSPTDSFSVPQNRIVLDPRSRALRRQIIRTMAAGNRGHVASAFSLVEILRVLYDGILKYDPTNPRWEGRDRCILSKGHGCLALYAILAEKGFFPEEWLDGFCKSEGKLGGHPEYGKVPGVEASTGSLGHGLAIGTGMALDARLRKSGTRTFVIIGDGESGEGSVWESAMSAAKHGLDNLTVLVDYNKQQSYATTYEVLNLEPLADKWRAFGWEVAEVDGHDVTQLRATLEKLPLTSGKPNILICHTIKGKGVSFIENNLNWHHKTKLPLEETEAILKELADAP